MITQKEIINPEGNFDAYQVGIILRYMLSVYHGEMAGKPNIPIPIIR